ncbi:cobalt-precorrin-6A reductase [Roseibium aestuarii]|uniref:Cobalt-precorrin-6A reductase n=1 Tax=Roseibium aestuarii TaxID=2600299 RepID=A0ABW4JVQ4_9HYPH|nr:cobalt-precorrin-6A reductase [Roseibium aestuarii]
MAEPRVLVLAGSPEARRLAALLEERHPDWHVTLSYAGAISALAPTGYHMRIGGFGGVDGLVDWLRREQTSLVVDATHPFARQMTRHAAEACRVTGLPLLRLLRPAWGPEAGDDWTEVASTGAAVDLLLGLEAPRPFLAIGRQEVAQHVGGLAHLACVLRSIEAPDFALPDGWTWLQGRPDLSEEAERRLLADHAVTHVVTKNSGGTGAAAKLVAARQLGLPVLMIARPPEPDMPRAETAEEAVNAMLRILAPV